MPFSLAALSEKSITLAVLSAVTAVSLAAFIQKVIVKLVEPKYVSVGSVRKLLYGVATATSAFLPLM
jgi:hypothetical protein